MTQLYAGTAPEAVDLNGQYLIPWARKGRPSRKASDDTAARELWDLLEGTVKDI